MAVTYKRQDDLEKML
ncbi:SPJ_0845 family protein, partial [Streptococcus suis]